MQPDVRVALRIALLTFCVLAALSMVFLQMLQHPSSQSEAKASRTVQSR